MVTNESNTKQWLQERHLTNFMPEPKIEPEPEPVDPIDEYYKDRNPEKTFDLREEWLKSMHEHGTHAAIGLDFVVPIHHKSFKQLAEDYPMPQPSHEKAFETLDFIYGVPADEVTDEQLIDAIEELQSKIIDLESLKVASKYVQTKIKTHKADQKKLVDALDSRIEESDADV